VKGSEIVGSIMRVGLRWEMWKATDNAVIDQLLFPLSVIPRR
jgi:hypothetical protein